MASTEKRRKVSNKMEPRSERVAVRLRPSDKEAAEAMAREEKRTLSSWIEVAVSEAIERRRREQKG